MIKNITKILVLKNFKKKNNIFFQNYKENYVSNFGLQWKSFRKTQVDNSNGTKISYKLMDKVIFSEWKNLYNKNILEIGCGSGRFTQYLSNLSSFVVANDMSNAIWNNNFLKKKNIVGIKCDYQTLKKLGLKFDIIFCRGVLQHTPNPLNSIVEIHSMLKKNGSFYFDIYRKPRLGFLNSKYLWRLILKNRVNYNTLENFLKKYLKYFLKLRWKLNSILMVNLNFLWDYIFPIYDYKGKLLLKDEKLIEWAILDTLDGLLAEYDTPYHYNEVKKYLSKKKIKIRKFNFKYHCFKI